MKVVTEEQMREIDRVAIEERDVPSLDLMERAGAAVADLITERLAPERVAICAGKGNNAGDGFVVARLLSDRGVAIDLFLAVPPEELAGDAAANFTALPRRVHTVIDPDGEQFRQQGARAEVVVDAVLGTGVSGRVRDPLASMVAAIGAHPEQLIVAVDIPSGLSEANLAEGGPCVEADATVTMGLPKLPMLIHPGADHVGELIVADIGFPADLLTAPELDINLIDPETVLRLLPARPADSHKGTFGHLLIIAGSAGMGGAAALAAQAAVRSGVGLVTVAVPEVCLAGVEAHVLSALKRPLKSRDPGHLDESALDQLEEEMDQFDAVALGPGLGQAPATQRLILSLIARVRSPLILDADGLNVLASQPGHLAKRSGPSILTPHPKEMERIAGTPVAEIQRDRLTAARRFAAEHGVVTVLKGAGTIIAQPPGEGSGGGEVWINPTGNSGLAKGGSGDVLTGLIGGLAAQTMSPLAAAICGVHWHGFAADIAAEQIPPRAMTPDDVIANLAEASGQILGEIEAE